jgi:predicted Zn-dependent peptidase
LYVYGPTNRPPLADAAAQLHAFLRERTLAALTGPEVEAGEATHAAAVPPGSREPRGELEALTLGLGTRVILQRDARLPLVALAAYVPVGSGLETPEEAGITRLMQTTMLKGAGGRSAADLAAAIDRLGVRLGPQSDRDTAGWSVGAVREDLPEAFSILRTVLSEPDFPEEATDRERTRTMAQIAAMRDDTVSYTVSQFFRLLFPGHAYGRPSLGTEEAVAGLESRHLAAWHRRNYDPSRMVVGVVGDFDRAAVLGELEVLAAALPRSAARLPGPPSRSGKNSCRTCPRRWWCSGTRGRRSAAPSVMPSRFGRRS